MSVEVQSLTKIYGEQRAVDNVSFTAEKGKVLGFLGPNGAGKSTTMKIAIGYIPPSEGTVLVDGVDVTSSPLEVQKKIGYLPELNPLYYDMYIKDYLKFTGELYGMKSKALKSRVGEMIELVGLNKEQHKKINALSKGYKQRVGLAQALIHDPEVLILDEPTTGFDPNQVLEIREVIRQISHNKTVIFSTHIMQEVQALCDKVVIINNGKIVADDELKNLSSKVESEARVIVEFSNAIDFTLIKQIDNVVNVEKVSDKEIMVHCNDDALVRKAIFKLAVEKDWDLIGLNRETQSLENIFHEITKNKA